MKKFRNIPKTIFAVVPKKGLDEIYDFDKILCHIFLSLSKKDAEDVLMTLDEPNKWQIIKYKVQL